MMTKPSPYHMLNRVRSRRMIGLGGLSVGAEPHGSLQVYVPGLKANALRKSQGYCASFGHDIGKRLVSNNKGTIGLRCYSTE